MEPVKWSWKGVLAVVYVFVFGGVVAYSAYLYAMKHLPVSLVSIYTYVNPVVAVLVARFSTARNSGRSTSWP